MVYFGFVKYEEFFSHNIKFGNTEEFVVILSSLLMIEGLIVFGAL